jgi:hypothetical protein
MEDGSGRRPEEDIAVDEENLKVIPLRYAPHFQRVADQYNQP